MARTASSTAYTATYEYDLLGNLKTLIYPSTTGTTRRKVEHAYNSNGEATSVKDVTDASQANWYNYVSNVTYSNLGPINQMDFGAITNPGERR